ncbi:hypothetical protein GCM10008106_34680 [Mongoliitalea lutea]|uniref:Uncharacterized protein n=2 Tax=Mongoliitalea lutea TaxID=849756 RepID=A0A8J3G6S9_9BACT|nr:hypothetical protein GCM10008106_34680 [Mongoliitalea lutea]
MVLIDLNMTLRLNLLLIFTVFLDPILEARWVIQSFTSFERVLDTQAFQAMDTDQHIRAYEMYSLAMKEFELVFKGDTIFFKDLRNEAIIDKKGIWYIDKDTLIINDLEIMASYKYFIQQSDSCRLILKPILPGPKVAKYGSTYKFIDCY